MDWDGIRPIVSGLVGAAVAGWLASRWARTLPEEYRAKSREQLFDEQKAAIRAANALFLAGLFFGIALYTIGGYPDSDPWPLAVGFGVASTAPLLALVVIPACSRRSVKEAFVAFAWGQGTPMWVTYGILGFGVAALIWALISRAADS